MSRAEDLDSAKVNKFAFQWTITNLYMFGGSEGKELVSPKFTVPSLDDSEWYLKLVLQEDNKSAMCFLHRTDRGPENVKINYSLSVGSSYSMEIQSFERNSSSIMPGIVNIHELSQKVDEGLSKDVLIECRMWQSVNEFLRTGADPASPYAVSCSTRTVIPCEQRNFYFPINEFTQLSNGLVASIRVDTAGDSNLKFIYEFSKVSLTTLGKKFQWKFVKSDLSNSTAFVIKYRIQLVDAVKKRHILLSGRFTFDRDSYQLTFLIPTSMLEKNNLYMPGDTMLLSCEFAISANNDVSLVESTCYDSSDIQTTNPVCGWDVYLDQKYNEHRFLFRVLAVLMIIFALIIPHLFTDDSV